jgi:DNA-directed RNA polymerase subunit RPC12/RpoP
MPKFRSCTICGQPVRTLDAYSRGRCYRCGRKYLALKRVLNTIVKHGVDAFVRHMQGERGNAELRDHAHWGTYPTEWESATGFSADIFGLLEFLDALGFEQGLLDLEAQKGGIAKSVHGKMRGFDTFVVAKELYYDGSEEERSGEAEV